MPQKKNKQKVNVDGTEYLLDDLSENAKVQVNNIQFVDAQLQHLQSELAVSDTARIGYANALKLELAKGSSNE